MNEGRQMDIECFVNLYKDLHGVRPRGDQFRNMQDWFNRLSHGVAPVGRRCRLQCSYFGLFSSAFKSAKGLWVAAAVFCSEVPPYITYSWYLLCSLS